MDCVRNVLFILSLCVLYGLCKRTCSYDDSKCLVVLAKENQPDFVEGVPGQIESSDPLHVDQANGDIPEMTFNLKNITLRGLKNCVPVFAKIEPKKSLFDFNLDCDVLYVTKEYEIHGRKAGIPAEAIGANTVTMHNCSLEKNGRLKLNSKEIVHFQVIDFQVNTLVKGEVEIEDPSLSKEARDQWKTIEELLRPVMMRSLISKYYKNIYDYTRYSPLQITFQ